MNAFNSTNFRITLFFLTFGLGLSPTINCVAINPADAVYHEVIDTEY
jgi:hypothetical protein